MVSYGLVGDMRLSELRQTCRVYNILAHTKESENIAYEDPDPENGFILLPDL